MSVHLQFDVFCDACGDWEHGGNERNRSRARLYVQGTYPGWVRRSVGGRMVDLCPGCAASLPEKPSDVVASGQEA